jgi:hypothetical protein
MGAIVIGNVRRRFDGFDQGQKLCPKGTALFSLISLPFRMFILLAVF